jgi:hypothetical protein
MAEKYYTVEKILLMHGLRIKAMKPYDWNMKQ